MIKLEIKKGQERGKDDQASMFGPNTWSLPSHIISFLKPTIEKLDEFGKCRLMQWPDFKKTLFEIIDHRIFHSPEINGLINNTYMSMDEHLVLYWVDQC